MNGCGALHILRGAMGHKANGKPVTPGHSRDKNRRLDKRCRFCYSTR